MTVERSNKRSQMSFVNTSGEIMQFESLKDIKGMREIINIVQSRRLWREKPKGAGALFLDYSTDKIWKVFSPDNFQITAYSLPEIDRKKRVLTALLLRIPNISDPETLDLEEVIESASYRLHYRAPIIIFEKKGQDNDENKRISIMRQLNFVDKRVLVNKHPDYWIWEARIESRRKKRTPLDLLDGQKYPRSRNYAIILWKEMTKEYAEHGFKIVNGKDCEIVRKLHASINPPKDFSKLKMGWGVELIGNCGCHLKRDLQGTDDYIYQCLSHKEEKG